MNKEEWFEHFERIEAEHPKLSGERVADLAREAQQGRYSTLVDQLMDERKYNPKEPESDA